MSALARYFKNNGKNIAGYDRVSTEITSSLQDLGIEIHFEDNIELISKDLKNKKNTIVIYTPAIPKNHKELNYFRDNDFIIMKRSEVLGEITKNSICLAVAGTHGKTTTSTILGHILKEAGVNATSFLGGISENYNSNLIMGGEDITVVEADEFDRSFLNLSPNIACILSTDADHLDIYEDHLNLEKSFKKFSEIVSDKLFVKKGISIDGLSFGVEEKADFNAYNIRIKNGNYTFDVKTPDEIIRDIKINLPGRHNILNSVAALSMARGLGVSSDKIVDALKSFKGIQRRFSYKINTDNLVMIDDYAHHPTEIDAVINSVREMYPNNEVLGIFQPHLFSRTKDFVDEFAKSLSKFDEIILLPIYPARELPISGVNSEWLLNKIDVENKRISQKENLVENILDSNAQIILMMGAGDIGELVENVKESLLNEN